jgi:hypothetical protein
VPAYVSLSFGEQWPPFAAMLYGGLREALPNDWQIPIVASSACAPDPNMREDSAMQSSQQRVIPRRKGELADAMRASFGVDPQRQVFRGADANRNRRRSN